MQRSGNAPVGGSNAADRTLLARARDGDARAFETVATARLPGAYRLARAILGRDADAADAATNALIAAWHELPRLEDLERFDDWLDRIVISECRMRLGQSRPDPAAGGVPADLVERTMRTVNERPRTSGGRGRTGARGRLLPFVAVLVVGIPVLAVALLAAGGRLGPTHGGPGTSAPRASEIAGAAATPAPSGSPSGATPPSTGEVPGRGLAIGSLAAVTLEGDNLRVRSLPGVGEASKRLKPTLPAGTRMLIVDGPVAVDGYDWYEVETDGELIDLFGWVAAAGDGIAWIAPAEPRCLGAPGAATVAGLRRVDFLACYGDTEVRVKARAAGLWDVHARTGDCGWVRDGGTCDVDNAWLLLPSAPVTLITDSGDEHDIVLAMPPELAEKLTRLPRQSTLLLTVSMDAPESTGCRVRDAATGKSLLPDEQAITACRLQFVVQEVAFRDSGAGPSPSPEAPAG